MLQSGRTKSFLLLNPPLVMIHPNPTVCVWRLSPLHGRNSQLHECHGGRKFSQIPTVDGFTSVGITRGLTGYFQAMVEKQSGFGLSSARTDQKRKSVMTKLRPLWMCLFLLSCSCDAAVAQQWNRFRGPNGSGVSAATNLPVEFGPDSNVVWKTTLPPGHSSPTLTATRIFLTAHTKEKETYKLLVLCLDRASGKILWQREVPRLQKGRIQNVNGPASPSPVTDGTSVYVFFQEFGLLAYDADGTEKWRMPLGPFNIFYGFGASPILVDDKVILAVDQDLDAYLIAVDKKTGKILWKVARQK
jgi:hypothetical protein